MFIWKMLSVKLCIDYYQNKEVKFWVKYNSYFKSPIKLPEWVILHSKNAVHLMDVAHGTSTNSYDFWQVISWRKIFKWQCQFFTCILVLILRLLSRLKKTKMGPSWIIYKALYESIEFRNSSIGGKRSISDRCLTDMVSRHGTSRKQ